MPLTLCPARRSCMADYTASPGKVCVIATSSAHDRERDGHPSRGGDLDAPTIAVGALPAAVRPHVACGQRPRPALEATSLRRPANGDLAERDPARAVDDRGPAGGEVRAAVAEHQGPRTGVD